MYIKSCAASPYRFSLRVVVCTKLSGDLSHPVHVTLHTQFTFCFMCLTDNYVYHICRIFIISSKLYEIFFELTLSYLRRTFNTFPIKNKTDVTGIL